MLVLKNVHSASGLRGASLRIDPGECICLIGPSGAGKSALLHALIGATSYTKGSITIDGLELKDLPDPLLRAYRQKAGFVFQDHKLLPYRTVEENIAFPLLVCGKDEQAMQKRIDEVLRLCDLVDIAEKHPRELSEGEKTRTAIARAIASEPLLLYIDEPTGSLDPEHVQEITELLSALHNSGTTLMVASQKPEVVEALGGRIVTIEEGTIVSDTESHEEHDDEHAEIKKAKHKIFTESSSQKPKKTSSDPQKKKASSSGTRKKIRVTSINS